MVVVVVRRVGVVRGACLSTRHTPTCSSCWQRRQCHSTTGAVTAETRQRLLIESDDRLNNRWSTSVDQHGYAAVVDDMSPCKNVRIIQCILSRLVACEGQVQHFPAHANHVLRNDFPHSYVIISHIPLPTLAFAKSVFTLLIHIGSRVVSFFFPGSFVRSQLFSIRPASRSISLYIV